MKQVFEAYIDERALRKAQRHFETAAESGVEAMGLLAGEAGTCEGQEFVVVTDYLTGKNNSTAATTRLESEGIAEIAASLSNKSGEKNKLIVGWAHCLPPEELMMTSEGVKTVKEAYEEFGKTGKLRVPSIDFEKKRVFYAKVTRAGIHKTNCLVTLETQLGRRITASPQHKLLVLRHGKMVWVPTALISEDDYVGIPATLPAGNTKKIDLRKTFLKRPKSAKCFPKLPEKLSSELMYYMGLLYSDGHVRPRAYIEFANSDEKLIKEFCALTRKLFGLTPKKRIRSDVTLARVLSRRVYLYLTESLGFTKKTLPKIVFKASKPQVWAFIRGLIAGDGSITKVSERKKEEVIQIHLGEEERLTYELVYLLSAVGKKARARKQKQNFAIRKHDYIYSAAIQKEETSLGDIIPNSGEEIKKICRKHGISIRRGFAVKKSLTRKRLRLLLEKISRKTPNDPLIKNLKKTVNAPVIWVKVKKKNTKKKSSDVYDFLVPKTGNFIAGHGPIIAHNSHPGYGCFMSTADENAQRAFFPERFHIAVVVDPVNNEKKVFKLCADGTCREASYAVIAKK